LKQKILKKKSRKDLLEILVFQNQKIEKLQEELKKVNELLNEKEFLIKEISSITETTFKLKKICDTLEINISQYLNNIKPLEKNRNILNEVEYNKKECNQNEKRTDQER